MHPPLFVLFVKWNQVSRLHVHEIENRAKHKEKSLNQINTLCKDELLECSRPSGCRSGTSVSRSQRGFHRSMLQFYRLLFSGCSGIGFEIRTDSVCSVFQRLCLYVFFHLQPFRNNQSLFAEKRLWHVARPFMRNTKPELIQPNVQVIQNVQLIPNIGFSIRCHTF